MAETSSVRIEIRTLFLRFDFNKQHVASFIARNIQHLWRAHTRRRSLDDRYKFAAETSDF